MKNIGHKLGSILKIAAFLSGGIIVAPAYAVFSVTNCSDTVSTGVPEIECRAMEALWDSTNGPGWTNTTGWDTNTPIDSWYNIIVSGGHITEILLNQNNLSGSIPPELGELTALTTLRLYTNQLSGSIPPEIGNINSLELLSIYDNQLSGSIPAALGNLGNLTVLNLFDNELNGSIPASLGNLMNLEQLYLNSNELIGSIPPELGGLAKLQFLSLDGNMLTGPVPLEFANLNALFNLVLTSNQLSGSIPDLSGNAELVRLYFDQNHFVFADFESEHLTYNTNLRTYTYHPQDGYVDSARSINFTSGLALTITPELAENPSGNDQYQWYKNGIFIPAPAGIQRVFSKTAAAGDAGDYTYRVSNSIVNPMQLISHPGLDAIVVTVGDGPPGTYTVGGTVSGLAGSLILQNNGLDNLLRSSDGSFTFANALADGAPYSVAVSSQPSGQTCTVSNASGVIATVDVSNVMVTCVDDSVPTPPGTAQPIPTLSFMGLSLLAVLVGLIGIGWRRL